MIFKNGSENIRSTQNAELNQMPSTMMVNDQVYEQKEDLDGKNKLQEENLKYNMEK